MKRLLLACLIVMLTASVALSASVTLSWTDPTACVDGTAIGSPTCPAITAHKVYCGSASGVYGAPVSLGTVLTYSWTVSTAQTLYCAVTCSNSAGESGKSNEATKVVTITPVPTRAPVCSFQ
jgi:hypothetical protein